MNNDQMRNMYSVIDCLDFLVTFEEHLTDKEKADISDPINLSCTVLRRMIGKLFPTFTIRKNTDQYSIKCESREVYAYLYVCDIFRHGGGIQRKMHPDYLKQIEDAIAPLRNVFNDIDRQVLSYKFRDGERLFFYVDYGPFTHRYYYGHEDRERFTAYGLVTRTNKLIRLQDGIKDLKPNPILDKFVRFYDRFGRVYYPGDLLIDEAFVDFALSDDNRAENLNVINTRWKAQQKVKLTEVKKEVKEEEPVVVQPARPTITLNTTTARPGNVAPEDAQARFTAALERVRERENPDTERFLTVDVPQTLEDEEAPETLPHLLSDIEYIRNIRRVEDFAFTPPVTDVDIYDDDDRRAALSGLYFGVHQGELMYQVYQNGECVFSSNDYDKAKDYTIELFGRLNQIGYLEDVYERHDHTN